MSRKKYLRGIVDLLPIGHHANRSTTVNKGRVLLRNFLKLDCVCYRACV